MEEINIVKSEATHIGRFDVIYDTIEKNGELHPYSYIKMKRGVGVLAFVNGKIILIHQYRYIWDQWFYEIPGGMVDDGENPIEAAKRELEEETGFKVKEINPLGVCYPSIGSTTEMQYLYVAECEGQETQKLDAIEKINIRYVDIEEFKRMLKDNEFCHGMGLAAWAMYTNINQAII